MSGQQKVSAYVYTPTERAQRCWSVVENYRPQSEVFALKYGGFILAVPTMVTSILTQRFFNRRFKIGGKTFFTYVPMVVPSIGTGLLHRTVIEENVLLERVHCTGCTEFKAASIHLIAGVAWSFLLSSLAGCMIGSLKKTVYVPPIEKYPLETLKLVGKHFRRFLPTAIAMCLGNVTFALVLTNFEVEQYKTMKNRLLTRLNAIDLDVTPGEFDEEFSPSLQ